MKGFFPTRKLAASLSCWLGDFYPEVLGAHLNHWTQGCVTDISLDTSDGVEAEPSLFPLRASEGRLAFF